MTTIHARSLEGYQVDVTTANHRILIDEPISVGGTDLGPNPYDLLLGALAACKAITVRMYAERKDWPLEDVYITMTHDKVHADLCAECETERGKVDVIELEIEFVGDLTPAQRLRLKEISEMCPVHRSLTSETVVRTITRKPA